MRYIKHIQINQYSHCTRIEYSVGRRLVAMATDELYMWYTSISLNKKAQYERISKDLMGLKK